jgi:hypothetical protein
MNTTATTYLRYSEPTVCSQASQAYSQCLPEPNYGYSPKPRYGYGSYYNEQAPMPQPPMPVQAPVAQSSSSSAGKGLLFVAGLAVVGAAAFGGVYLMNSTSSEPTANTSAAPAATPSTVVNLPSAVDIPALAPAQNAPAPVIVNNPAPVRVSGPVSVPRSVSAPKQIVAPKPITAPAPVAAPAPAPAAPAPAPKPAGGPGVAVKTPFAEVGVPSQGGVSVKTPGVEVGVSGQNGGDVVVAVPSGQKPADKPADQPAQKQADQPADQPAAIEGTKPAGGASTTAEGTKAVEQQKVGDVIADVTEAAGGAGQAVSGVAGG